ncbi:MAG: hypothetical protein M3P39_07945 [Actinomycetota bacterium]|nr:hypothetical protein [Actinomycetota bacterium]
MRRYLRVEGREDVWAIGDAAAVPDPAKGYRAPCPPTAQHAIRQGRRAARNVAAALGRGRRSPFRYRTLGVFVDMGNREAVASTLGVRWRGLPACTYHLALMPGLHRRAQLLTEWNVGLVFGRDTAELGQLGHPPALDGSGDGASPGMQAVASGDDADLRLEARDTGSAARPGPILPAG